MGCSHKNLIIDIILSQSVIITTYLLIITHPVSYDVITMDDKWLEALDKWDSMTEAPEIPPACFAGKITYDQALELATKIRDYSRWQMQILLGEWEYTPLE